MLFWKKKSGEIARLEAKLAEAEQEKLLAWNLLDAMNNSAHLGIWTAHYNEAGEMERVHYSDEFRRMLGYTKEELPDTIEGLRDIIHPDETRAVFGLYGAAGADRSGLTKFDINYRLLTKKDGYRWFRAMGECVRRPDRTPPYSSERSRILTRK